MEKFPPNPPIAQARDDSANPLWIITVMLAVFAVVTAAIVAWG